MCCSIAPVLPIGVPGVEIPMKGILLPVKGTLPRLWVLRGTGEVPRRAATTPEGHTYP